MDKWMIGWMDDWMMGWMEICVPRLTAQSCTAHSMLL
jgi:hypothetical protein